MKNQHSTQINKIKNLAPKLNYLDRLELCSILLDENQYHINEDKILSSSVIQKIIFNKTEIKKNLIAFHQFGLNYLKSTFHHHIKIILPIYHKGLNKDDFNKYLIEIIQNKDHYADNFKNEQISTLAEFKSSYTEETMKEIILHTDDVCFALEALIDDNFKNQLMDKNMINEFVHKYHKKQIEGLYYLKRNNINTQDPKISSLLFTELIEYKCQRLLKLIFTKEQIAEIFKNNFSYYLIQGIHLIHKKEKNIIFHLIKQNMDNKTLKSQLKSFITTKKQQSHIMNECIKMGYINFQNFKVMYEFFKEELLAAQINNPYKQILNFYQIHAKKVKEIIADFYRYSDEFYASGEDLKALTEEVYNKELIEFENLTLTDRFNSNTLIKEVKKVRKI